MLSWRAAARLHLPFTLDCLHLCSHSWLSSASADQSVVQAMTQQLPFTWGGAALRAQLMAIRLWGGAETGSSPPWPHLRAGKQRGSIWVWLCFLEGVGVSSSVLEGCDLLLCWGFMAAFWGWQPSVPGNCFFGGVSEWVLVLGMG